MPLHGTTPGATIYVEFRATPEASSSLENRLSRQEWKLEDQLRDCGNGSGLKRVVASGSIGYR